jgi:hypothetical protein
MGAGDDRRRSGENGCSGRRLRCQLVRKPPEAKRSPINTETRICERGQSQVRIHGLCGCLADAIGQFPDHVVRHSDCLCDDYRAGAEMKGAVVLPSLVELA